MQVVGELMMLMAGPTFQRKPQMRPAVMPMDTCLMKPKFLEAPARIRDGFAVRPCFSRRASPPLRSGALCMRFELALLTTHPRRKECSAAASKWPWARSRWQQGRSSS
jgi:hypothetical protein